MNTPRGKILDIGNPSPRKVRAVVSGKGVARSWAIPAENAAPLVRGREYNLVKMEVHSWHTKVFLAEFPGVPFNSVWFGDCIGRREYKAHKARGKP